MRVIKAGKSVLRKAKNVAKAAVQSVGIAGSATGSTRKRVGQKSSTQLEKSTLQSMLSNTYMPNSMSGPVGSYIPDPTLSDNRVKVYHDASTNHTVVAHRGSQTKADWLENGLYAMGIKGGANYNHSKKVQKAAEKKYGSSNLTTVGHSKGALHAQEFGQHGDIATLNKPVNVKDALFYKVPKNQTDYRGEGDAVSALRFAQRGNKAVTLKKGKSEKSSYNPFKNLLTEHGTATLERES